MTDRHEFTTVDSELVYEGKILALRLDQVSMPGGRTAEREVVEHHGAVAVVAVDDDGRIVLIEQYRHPLGRRLLELPAGLLDIDGEDHVIAAQRELGEETGLSAARWSLLIDVAASPGFTDETVRVFLAEGLSDIDRSAPVDEEADIEIRRVDVDDAVRMVLAGDIVNASAVSGILTLALVRSQPKLPLRPTDAPWRDLPRALERRKGESGR